MHRVPVSPHSSLAWQPALQGQKHKWEQDHMVTQDAQVGGSWPCFFFSIFLQRGFIAVIPHMHILFFDHIHPLYYFLYPLALVPPIKQSPCYSHFIHSFRYRICIWEFVVFVFLNLVSLNMISGSIHFPATKFYSSLWLNNTPLCLYTFSLSIYGLMNTYTDYIAWPVRAVLL
jgi:hypothetical protein